MRPFVLIALVLYVLTNTSQRPSTVPPSQTSTPEHNNAELSDGLVNWRPSNFVPSATVYAEPQPGRVRVPRKNTPIDLMKLMVVLQNAHQEVFGVMPSRRRLAGALAQIRAENGNGLKVYGHNLGNIGLAPRMKAAYYHHGAGIYLVFKDFAAGAQAYWRTAGRCTSAMAAFEALDPNRAARAFHRCGYHTTNPDTYAAVLRPLYWSSFNMLDAG